ncbi:MAG: DUF6305 family protein [Pyramidobacter sp.]|uniref:DUF6305 family protein n=1 Tax=Pyramidobacter sp. TaxID=1943581 RepID=UPI002A7F203B|nr:DUF6305 family protein [Pyramidobacter sp.]MDY4032818.1 DUF6305 family protein [Pyramidobacter sp.]
MKLRKNAAVIVAVLCMSAAAWAGDVALTPIGQSPDGMMVRVVLRSLKVATDYEPLMKPESLKDQKVLVAVVGASSKGMGAAGINQEDELARAKALCEAAAGKGMKILVMHVGGEGRRGGSSNAFIEAASAYADDFIVVDGGNTDGLFDRLAAARKAEILTAPNVKGTKEPLKTLLAKWGIL